MNKFYNKNAFNTNLPKSFQICSSASTVLLVLWSLVTVNTSFAVTTQFAINYQNNTLQILKLKLTLIIVDLKAQNQKQNKSSMNRSDIITAYVRDNVGCDNSVVWNQDYNITSVSQHCLTKCSMGILDYILLSFILEDSWRN